MSNAPETALEVNTPQLERAQFAGTIHIIQSFEELNEAYKTLCECPVLGFDTETRPTFTKGHADRFVSIVQFSTANEAWIIRTNVVKLPPKLRTLLEHPAIVKVGLALHEDIRRLQQFHPFAPQNIVDLQKLAKAAGYKELSLKKLSERFLQLGVSKAARLSNWEADTLTERQITYAATDAWLCYQLYYLSGLVEASVPRT